MKRSLLALMVVAAASGSALAIEPEYCTGFDSPDYNVGLLTGQDAWFIPVAGSVDYNVAAYGGPIAPNPTGGNQYAVGVPASTTAFARAQHSLAFDSSAQYTLAYDINVLPFGGKGAAVNNIGSFSLQNSTTSRFTQSLFTWNDLANPAAGWTTSFANINAAGTNTGFTTPGAGFTGLSFNHWYRQSLLVDFATNELLSISITDLATNTTTTASLTGVYLGGGANNVLGLIMPDAFRMFTGGDPNNVTLWDNVCLEVVPAPATGALGVLGLALLGRRRR